MYTSNLAKVSTYVRLLLVKYKERIVNDLDFIRKHVREWPEGATGVKVDCTGEIKFQGVKGNSDKYDFYTSWHDWETFMPVDGDKVIGAVYTKAQWAGAVKTSLEWTIFNNTLPLKHLDAHQRGELFNHWMINKTGSMTFLYSGVFTKVNNVLWSDDTIYRAKPIVAFTERELFIKEAKHYESVEDMFDSGKFKLVDEIPEKMYTFTNKVAYVNIF
jgi:hypothetical protein